MAASVSRQALQHTKVPATSAQLLSCCCSTTTAYLVIVEFLLCSACKRETEMLLFTVVCTFQEPVHDAVESILKSLLHSFFFLIAHSLLGCRALQRWLARLNKKVQLKNGAEQPRRTPLNQSVIAGCKTESKTRRFHSYSCD